VSAPTTEALPAMLHLDDNYSSSDEVYLEPAGSITTDHSAKWHKTTHKKPIRNLTDLPELPTFSHLQLIVTPHKAWKGLHILFSKLDDITPVQIFNLFLTNSIIGQLGSNTTSYAYNLHFQWSGSPGTENGKASRQ
jgi:hypothetical protein